MFFEAQNRPHIYAYTTPQFEEVEWNGIRPGKGLLKVGYTSKNVQERIDEQFPVKGPVDNQYTILLDEFAILENSLSVGGTATNYKNKVNHYIAFR